MEIGLLYTQSIDSLETVTLCLEKLNSMIMSLCLGMQQENMEQQAVNCMECIGYCVSDIRNTAVDRLQQLEELQGQSVECKGHEQL